MNKLAEILVIGANTKSGSAIVKALIKENTAIRIFKTNLITKETFNNKSDLIEFVDGNLLDVLSLEDAMQGISQVYLCSNSLEFANREFSFLYQNIIKTIENVVNNCLSSGVKKLVYISSTMAYGTSKIVKTIDEKTTQSESSSNTDFSICMNKSELEVARGNKEGLDTIIVNPSLIIDKNGNSNFLKSNILTIGSYGFVTEEDVAKASILLMNSKSSDEKYILNSENLSYQDFYNSINIKVKKPIGLIQKIKLNIAQFKSMFLQKNVNLNKANYAMMNKDFKFDNSKILKELDFVFTPISEYVK